MQMQPRLASVSLQMRDGTNVGTVIQMENV